MRVFIMLVFLIVGISFARTKKTVSDFEQQKCLPAFKKEWIEFDKMHSQAMQATVKRVDLAYGG
ncbi:hypothetical protein [Microseira sp. BLCC-F43]|uniref:hypothetical protein n=1 Tax=Microseira sp. BLCC-F43 TaxID=3153602 RepID=UPI0035BC65C0